MESAAFTGSFVAVLPAPVHLCRQEIWPVRPRRATLRRMLYIAVSVAVALVAADLLNLGSRRRKD